MRFIPTYCDECSCSRLTVASSILGGHSECPNCGSETRSVPGSSYGSEDGPLYQALADALCDACLAPLNAGRLLAQLDPESLHRSPGKTLSLVARALPSLAHLELLLSDDRTKVRKAEGMLVTLLAAHATGRSHSGILPAARPPAQSKATR